MSNKVSLRTVNIQIQLTKLVYDLLMTSATNPTPLVIHHYPLTALLSPRPRLRLQLALSFQARPAASIPPVTNLPFNADPSPTITNLQIYKTTNKIIKPTISKKNLLKPKQKKPKNQKHHKTNLNYTT